jgi:hypothetical protein
MAELQDEKWITMADGAWGSRIRTAELQVDVGNTAASEVGEARARPDVKVDGEKTTRGGRILLMHDTSQTYL